MRRKSGFGVVLVCVLFVTVVALIGVASSSFLTPREAKVTKVKEAPIPQALANNKRKLVVKKVSYRSRELPTRKFTEEHSEKRWVPSYQDPLESVVDYDNYYFNVVVRDLDHELDSFVAYDRVGSRQLISGINVEDRRGGFYIEEHMMGRYTDELLLCQECCMPWDRGCSTGRANKREVFGFLEDNLDFLDERYDASVYDDVEDLLPNAVVKDALLVPNDTNKCLTDLIPFVEDKLVSSAGVDLEEHFIFENYDSNLEIDANSIQAGLNHEVIFDPKDHAEQRFVGLYLEDKPLGLYPEEMSMCRNCCFLWGDMSCGGGTGQSGNNPGADGGTLGGEDGSLVEDGSGMQLASLGNTGGGADAGSALANGDLVPGSLTTGGTAGGSLASGGGGFVTGGSPSTGGGSVGGGSIGGGSIGGGGSVGGGGSGGGTVGTPGSLNPGVGNPGTGGVTTPGGGIGNPGGGNPGTPGLPGDPTINLPGFPDEGIPGTIDGGNPGGPGTPGTYNPGLPPGGGDPSGGTPGVGGGTPDTYIPGGGTPGTGGGNPNPFTPPAIGGGGGGGTNTVPGTPDGGTPGTHNPGGGGGDDNWLPGFPDDPFIPGGGGGSYTPGNPTGGDTNPRTPDGGGTPTGGTPGGTPVGGTPPGGGTPGGVPPVVVVDDEPFELDDIVGRISEDSDVSVIHCGDGITHEDHLDEECDDGNTSNNDMCTNQCTVARCGDGYIQPPNGENCELAVNPAWCVNCVYSPPPPPPPPPPRGGGRRGGGRPHYSQVAPRLRTAANRGTVFWGCYELNTKILLANGTTKPAAEIEEGDVLYNPVTKSEVTVSDKISVGEEEHPFVEFGFGDKTVKVTTLHPVLTDSGIKKAIDLDLNDKIMDVEGKYHEITVLKRHQLEPKEMVINFELVGDSTFDHFLVSDGIVTGDLFLQGLFENPAKYGPKKK